MISEKTISAELRDIESQMASQVQSTSAVEPSPVSTPEPVTPAPVTPAPAASEESKVTSTPSAAPVTPTHTVDVNAVVDNWDSQVDTTGQAAATSVAPVTPATQTPQPTPGIDVEFLAKALKNDTIKTKEDVLKTLETTSERAAIVDRLPEPMKKAVEIAALGGNYLEYLGVSQIDWSKEDPVVLYENYVEDQFTDPNTGQVDYEKVDKMLEKADEDEREFRGRELQRQYVNYQAQQKAAILAQAHVAKANFENSVRTVVDNMDNVAGFKLSQAHKDELYALVVAGQDLKPSDLQTRLFNAFITRYWPKIESFRKHQIKNSTLSKIIEEVTVPEITPVGSSPVSQPTKAFSLGDYIQEIRKK